MVRAKLPAVLLLLLPLLFCLGCGSTRNSKIRSCAKEFKQINQEIADQLNSIHDKATLDENSPKVLANYRKLFKLIKEFDGLRGSERVVKQVQADLIADRRRLEPQIVSSMKRIIRLPGGKEFIRSILNIWQQSGLPLYAGIESSLSNLSQPSEFPSSQDNGESNAERSKRKSKERMRERNEAQQRSRDAMNKAIQRARNNSRHPGPHGNAGASKPQIDLSNKTPIELISYFSNPDSSTATQSLTRINKVDPDSVSADEKRTIAQTLKQTAYNRSNDDRIRNLATKGLVIWGGKYSVPLLIELLDGSGYQQARTILKALDDFENYSAVEPVAKILAKGHSNTDIAVDYLAKAGPAAEQAVLDYVRPTSLQLTKETVQLLGEIGTRKSLKALVRLKSSNYYRLVEQEVVEARAAILDRVKADQP